MRNVLYTLHIVAYIACSIQLYIAVYTVSCTNCSVQGGLNTWYPVSRIHTGIYLACFIFQMQNFPCPKYFHLKRWLDRSSLLCHERFVQIEIHRLTKIFVSSNVNINIIGKISNKRRINILYLSYDRHFQIGFRFY